MNNFIEHTHIFTEQDDADDAIVVPLLVHNGPLRFIEAMVYLSDVAGSPTAVSIDLDITDGTTTNNVIAGGSIGNAAGQTRLTPDSQTDGTADIPPDGDDNRRYEIDFNFSGGTTPTASGTLVLRFAV
jgi:hypothetical protein